MRINNNLMAYNAQNKLNNNNNSVSNSVRKLSSGLKISRAGDDAAGLAISEKMRAQIRGLDMASKNSQDAISLIQTAEGALNQTHDILQRMRELSVQSASDTNDTDTDRAALDTEYQALASEINDIAADTAFNGQALLDGSFSGIIQAGANSGETLTLTFATNMDAETIMTTNGLGDLTSQANAVTEIDSVDEALDTVSTQRAALGALQNRLEYKIKNLDTSSENLQAAESRIRDLDMADEMTKFTSANILSQAATSMLAQANALPQNVLKLLG